MEVRAAPLGLDGVSWGHGPQGPAVNKREGTAPWQTRLGASPLCSSLVWRRRALAAAMGCGHAAEAACSMLRSGTFAAGDALRRRTYSTMML